MCGVRRATKKVAVTSWGPDVTSPVDPHFGRARYFLAVGTDTDQVAVHDNRGCRRSLHTAGMQAAGTLISIGVQAVITGHIGPRAFATLQSAGVEVYGVEGGTVGDAVEQLRTGKLQPLREANVREHWPQMCD